MNFLSLSHWLGRKFASQRALFQRARQQARRFYQHGYMREEVEALKRETQTTRRVK